MNQSAIGGVISATGKLLMAGGYFFPPLLIIGPILSALGSVISGNGADKTADALQGPNHAPPP